MTLNKVSWILEKANKEHTTQRVFTLLKLLFFLYDHVQEENKKLDTDNTRQLMMLVVHIIIMEPVNII